MDYFATFGSYGCVTRRYDNYIDVTFDVFSLNKSSGGLASQNHVVKSRISVINSRETFRSRITKIIFLNSRFTENKIG